MDTEAPIHDGNETDQPNTDPEPSIEQRTADPAAWWTWRHRQMMGSAIIV